MTDYPTLPLNQLQDIHDDPTPPRTEEFFSDESPPPIFFLPHDVTSEHDLVC